MSSTSCPQDVYANHILTKPHPRPPVLPPRTADASLELRRQPTNLSLSTRGAGFLLSLYRGHQQQTSKQEHLNAEPCWPTVPLRNFEKGTPSDCRGCKKTTPGMEQLEGCPRFFSAPLGQAPLCSAQSAAPPRCPARPQQVALLPAGAEDRELSVEIDSGYCD